MWNELLSVLLTSVGSLVILFLLCKLMGNRQISQLSMFDYIVGISIGSIAAEMATELEAPLYPALAMVLYGVIAFAISVYTAKCLPFRKLMTGKPILLLDNGVLYRENMKKARFDLSDFLTLCRINGYFDLNDLQTAIMEENGTVSFLPKSVSRPMTPADANLFPDQARICYNLVLDGVTLINTLGALGYTEAWLDEQLRTLGCDGPESVYLATVDAKGKVSAFPMTDVKPPFAPFD